MKDKAPYLAKWIKHHRSMGFECLLLYDNGIADDTRCVLDAYARNGDVTRIPEDVSACHTEDLPWLHESQILDNPQQAICDAYQRYIVYHKRDSGEIGLAWMLTSDVDKLMWFEGRPTPRTPSHN